VESWWRVARRGELVGYLTDDEHARLLALAESCSAAAGDLVFQKGSPSRSLLIVEEGQLEVFDESMGLPVVLAIVGPGGVVGEVGFVDGLPRTHNVRARGACRLWRLTREALLGLVDRDPLLFAKIAVGLAQLLTLRFRSAVEEMEPVRSFAAALREPLDFEDAPPQFDEIEAPLPEEDPDRKAKAAKAAAKGAAKSGAKAKTESDTRPFANPASEAVKVIRRAARRRRKGGSGSAV
jgi:CRP/FNR family transcriptional regulator, cyclic AMP receptor protein